MLIAAGIFLVLLFEASTASGRGLEFTSFYNPAYKGINWTGVSSGGNCDEPAADADERIMTGPLTGK